MEAKRSTFDLVIVLAIAAALAAFVVVAFRPSLAVTPLRLSVVRDILAGRSIAYSPYPVGYPLLAASAQRAMGYRGLSVVQAVLYLATVLLSYLTLAGFEAGRRFRIGGALAVALYPNLLFATTRFVDTVPSCFLLAAFAWLVMRLRRDGPSLMNSVICGALFGTMLLFRPNAITLAPIAFWAAFAGRSVSIRQTARLAMSRLAPALLLTVIILASATIPLKGKLVVFDRYYGAYTLANGAHAHAFEGTLRDYNGEMTMPEAMREIGLTYYPLDRNDPAIANMYLHMAFDYVRDHPGDYLALVALKLVNFFRPDYRNSGNSFVPEPVAYAIHTLIAGIFPLWILVRFLARRIYRTGEGLILIPAMILYSLPFLITNSDPRYRIPLDVLLVLDSAMCLWRLSRCEIAPGYSENTGNRYLIPR